MRINLLPAAIQTAFPVRFDAYPLQCLPIHPTRPAKLALTSFALHMAAPPNLHNIPPAPWIRTPPRRPRDRSPRRHVLGRPTLHLRALLVLRAGLVVVPGALVHDAVRLRAAVAVECRLFWPREVLLARVAQGVQAPQEAGGEERIERSLYLYAKRVRALGFGG